MSGIERGPQVITSIQPDSLTARFGDFHVDTEKLATLLTYEGVTEESMDRTYVFIHEVPMSRSRRTLLLSNKPIDRVIDVPTFARLAKAQSATKELLEKATNHSLLAAVRITLDREDPELQKAEDVKQFRTFLGLAVVGALTAGAVTEPTLATTLIGGVSSFVAGKGLASARRHVRTAKRAMRFANQKMSHPVWSSMIEIQERPARA